MSGLSRGWGGAEGEDGREMGVRGGGMAVLNYPDQWTGGRVGERAGPLGWSGGGLCTTVYKNERIRQRYGEIKLRSLRKSITQVKTTAEHVLCYANKALQWFQ